MALLCPRCNAPNEDSAAFCTRCGTPMGSGAGSGQGTPAPAPAPVLPSLPAAPVMPPQPAAPPMAPLFAAPPVPPAAPPSPWTGAPMGGAIPPNYYSTTQTPYYTPAPAMPPGTPVHRLSRNALIALVLAVVLVVAAAGVGFAALHKGTTTTTASTGGNVGPTPQPTPPGGTNPTQRPTPRPTVRPTPAPTGSGGGGGTGNSLTTGFVALTVPSTFHVADASGNPVELDRDPAPGQIFVGTFPEDAGASNSSLPAKVLKLEAKSEPDAADCTPAGKNRNVNLQGIGQIPAQAMVICGTYTPSNGAAFPAIDIWFIGVARDPSGATEDVFIDIFMPTDHKDDVINAIPNAFFDGLFFVASAPS